MMLGVCRDRVMSFSFARVIGEIINMANLGSKANPIRVNVHNEDSLSRVAYICDEQGWYFVAGMNQGEPEDPSELDRKLDPNS